MKRDPHLTRRGFLQAAAGAAAVLGRPAGACAARPGEERSPMKLIETDAESGARVYQLTDGERPADNIYGEQPYSSPDGRRIAVRYYRTGAHEGGLSLLDLEDGAQQAILKVEPRFPAFHAWGEYLYYQEKVDGRLLLKRCRYATARSEEVLALPADEGSLSYGTMSPDHRHYAVSAHPEQGGSKVVLVDVASGRHRTLVQDERYLFKHEQFSLDGANHVLIQANQMPDVKVVRLGVLDVAREGIRWLAADRPHTPRPTGHEAWVGQSDRVLYSTAVDPDSRGNLWISRLGEERASLVTETPLRFAHVSVSRCGRFWVGDVTGEKDIPIYVGSVATGRHRRALFSRTQHDGKQWSHTHPYLTADNQWLIYTSSRSGLPQVHGARLKKGSLEGLR